MINSRQNQNEIRKNLVQNQDKKIIYLNIAIDKYLSFESP